ncbi:oligosaccharide flippase family protein [Phocaeicola sp. HCN-40430]|uniref:oligosaccharide flippase family protein n=1 Tax=Phocaeicola sp. HCN-40430 TaxID=3134664 RepID=UPI0030BF86E4
MDNKNSQKRILKNTIYLYIRSLVSLIIQLYTSRIVLKALGIEDFGVYQVIGGIVTMFSFLNSTMSAATQRFLSYEMGLNNSERIQKVFSTAINIHIILALFTFIIIEILGIILIKSKIDLGNVDTTTAIWILHFTSLSLVLTITSVPYNSFLISKENMSYFAYIDILGAFLKLIVALILFELNTHRLIWYAVLLFIVSFIIRLLYSFICHIKYKEARYNFYWDKQLAHNMTTFSIWTTLSAFSYMIKSQGISVILNFFFGPVLNAAIGIANQVNAAVKTFSQNFQMSFMPQIVKTYAQQDYSNMNKLIYSGAKLSTYLLIAISIPIILEINFILNLWLSQVPQYAPIIISLILIESIIQTMTCTGNTAIRATGKIKWFEILTNGVQLIAIPIFLLYLSINKIYFIPFVIIILSIIISNIIKLFFIRKHIKDFDIYTFIKDIFIKPCLFILLSIIIPYLLKFIITEGIIRAIITCISFEALLILVIYKYGLNNYEKALIQNIIIKITKR